jgi:nucleotide-binding universal stress UspA family protein
MPSNNKILVAVDHSGAAQRTVSYVADMIGGQRDFHVGLVHLELPPRMLEWGGSEVARTEEKVADQRTHAYQELEKETIADGQEMLKRLQGILERRKIDVVARLVQFEEPLDPRTITEHILHLARERDYGTVVVGWHAFSGLKRYFAHHVSEELVRAGRGFSIWVVE